MAASAVLIASGAAVWVGLMRSDRRIPGDGGDLRRPPTPIAQVATFVVRPGLTRADRPQTNLFQVPGDARTIRLSIPMQGSTAVTVEAVVRAVGSSIPIVTMELGVSTDAAVSLDVDRPSLPSGDYVLGLTAVMKDGRREPLPSRFFTIA